MLLAMVGEGADWDVMSRDEEREPDEESYFGWLWLPAKPTHRVSVEVVVDGHAIGIWAGEELIGAWLLADTSVRAGDDGFHIRVDDGEAVVDVERPFEFARRLGVRWASPHLRRRILAGLAEAGVPDA